MRRLAFALIVRQDGMMYESFPPVDSLHLTGVFDLDAVTEGDSEDLASWKRRIRHYAASEGWIAVFFAECTEHAYNRALITTDDLPGDENFAIFPVRSEPRATEKESTDKATNSYHASCFKCGKPIEAAHGVRQYIYGKEHCTACAGLPIDSTTGDSASEEEAHCARCGGPVWDSPYALKGEPVCRDCAPDGL